MRACGRIVGAALVFLATFAVAQKPEFAWDWRNQEVIGREDASVGNTSKLTEPERTSLIDAIVLRLQKPMGDAGYDDDRIREIATTTRIRFIDVGAGQPLIFTTSIGLEGGCDALGNCPLWVFRHTDDGFLSLLNTIAASYTPKRDEGGFEVVFLHHLSAKESGLAVYRLADDKLQGTGCYTALWPKPSNDPTQVSDPKIEPCKQSPLLESAHPVQPEAPQPQMPAAAEPVPTQPAAEKPEAQPTPDTMEPKEQASPSEQPAAQPKQDTSEQAPPATENPKADQPQRQPQQQSLPDQPAPGAKQVVPKADEAQPPAEQPAPDAKQGAPKPDQAPPQQTPDAGQQAPDDKQAQPPKPDQPAQEAPPANPEAPPQASPQEPAPAPDSKPAPPSSSPDQAQPNPNR